MFYVYSMSEQLLGFEALKLTVGRIYLIGDFVLLNVQTQLFGPVVTKSSKF